MSGETKRGPEGRVERVVGRLRSNGIRKDAKNEAANLLEQQDSEIERQRVGWKCYAGGEEFTTYDESVADEWRRDGFDVEKFGA